MKFRKKECYLTNSRKGCKELDHTYKIEMMVPDELNTVYQFKIENRDKYIHNILGRVKKPQKIYNEFDEYPILLLDDIFDKLDDNRVSQLVNLVGNDHFGQVFITDTQRARIKYLMENTVVNYKIFNVREGVIESDNG